MPTTLAPPTTTRRPALGDRTSSHVNVSLNNKGDANPAILPVKPNKLILQVVDDAAPNPATTNTNKEAEATTTSTNKISTVVVQEDETTHQPTKMKRVDVFSDSTWDDITAKDNKANDDRRASIVSPTYSEEGFNPDEDDIAADLEEVTLKCLTGFVDVTGETTKTTSETIDAAKAVEKGYEFSTSHLEEMARAVVRPSDDESVEDAIKAMKAICVMAMADSGKNWKSIVKDQDKYNLLSYNNDKFRDRFLEKALYVLGVLDVVGDTVDRKLPPTVLKACELGRSKVLEWLGSDRTSNLEIPASATIYQWFRDFRNGRNFSHPERALHVKMQALDNLDKFFAVHPSQKQTFKAHIQSVLKQQRLAGEANDEEDTIASVIRDGTMDGNAYDFYCYFVNDILRPLSSNIPDAKRSADAREDECDQPAKKQEDTVIFDFLVEKLTWQHLSHWMDENWGQTRTMSWSI